MEKLDQWDSKDQEEMRAKMVYQVRKDPQALQETMEVVENQDHPDHEDSKVYPVQ